MKLIGALPRRRSHEASGIVITRALRLMLAAGVFFGCGQPSQSGDVDASVADVAGDGDASDLLDAAADPSTDAAAELDSDDGDGDRDEAELEDVVQPDGDDDLATDPTGEDVRMELDTPDDPADPDIADDSPPGDIVDDDTIDDSDRDASDVPELEDADDPDAVDGDALTDLTDEEADATWDYECEPLPPTIEDAEGWWVGTTLATGEHEVCGTGFRLSLPLGARRDPESWLQVDQVPAPPVGYVTVSAVFHLGRFPGGLFHPWEMEPGLRWRARVLPLEAPSDAVRGVVVVEDFGSLESPVYEAPVRWVDGGAEFEIDSDWVADLSGGYVHFFLGYPQTSICGDGIVDENEQCEDESDRCGGCHYLDPRCRPDDDVCHRWCSPPVVGWPAVDCSSEPVGPCEVAACDTYSTECVHWPAYEGEPCDQDGVAGRCRAGVCSPEQEECGLCSRGMRFVGGECWPEEAGMTFVAGRLLGPTMVPEGEARYSDGWAGYTVGESRWGLRLNGEPAQIVFTGTVGAARLREAISEPLVPTGTPDVDDPVAAGYLQVEYMSQPWSRAVTVFYDYYGSEDTELELVPSWSPVVRTETLGLPDPEGYPTLYSFAQLLYLRNDTSSSASGGYFYVTRVRRSHNPTGVCDVAVNVDGEWQTCPERPGATVCDGQCIDTRTNALNCGECGHACGDAQICAGGECVCDPRLARLDLPTCAWDACPEGWYGPGCRSVCAGVLEGEPQCNGNGECSDGPFGTGVCVCDPFTHGPNCEFRCDDGIRNGGEVNVDCGGTRCWPCE
ncbi:MAG: hypothetical protein H6697_03650 [Myxococcales bacterium]|nr:hypothetical protein [Myxococcales bacterium]